MKSIFTFIFCACLSLGAWSHKASDAYLQIATQKNERSIQLQYAIALRDLDAMIDTLDANQDRALTYGEVKAALGSITRLLEEKIHWRCEATQQKVEWQLQALDARSEGVFTQFAAKLPAACTLENSELQYTMLQGLDADHRLALSIQSAEHVKIVSLEATDHWTRITGGANESSRWASLKSFVFLGITHILQGADHIAFVICLVLGIALVQQWRQLLLTITAFTFGHSISLIAASIGQASAPFWVEPVIALSIAASAALNLAGASKNWLHHPRLRVALAFVFGGVHGWGFSGGLAQAQVPEQILPWALAGFNLGVEIGQLIVIAVWGMVYALAFEWKFYQTAFVKVGSIFLIGLSLFWAAQRMAFL